MERAPDQEPWVEIYRDDFDRAELGPAWEVLRGQVAIHDGALCSRAGHVVSLHEIGEWIRVDYEARIMPNSSDARELSAFVSGSRAGGLVDGYSFEFAILQDIEKPGYRHGLLRLRKAASFTSADPIVPERWYRIGVERRANRLELFGEGSSVLRFVDPLPLQGSDHRHFGFGSKAAHLHYDRVRVQVPLQDARPFAARALELRRWKDAELALAQIALREKDREGRDWLELQRARCLLRQRRDREAGLLLAGVTSERWKRSARAHQAELSARRGDHQAALIELLTADGAGALSDVLLVKESLAEIFGMLESRPPDAVRAMVEGALAKIGTPDPSLLEATVTLLFDRGSAPELTSLPRPTWRTVVHSYPYAAAKPALDEVRRQLAGEPRVLIGILATMSVRASSEGRIEDARALAEEASLIEVQDQVEPSLVLAQAWAFLGDEKRALRHRARFSEDSAVSATRIAYILLALSRDDEAFELFGKIADRWGDGSLETAEAHYLIGRVREDRLDRFGTGRDSIDRYLLRGLRSWHENDFVSARAELEHVLRDGSPARALDHLLARRLIHRLRR